MVDQYRTPGGTPTAEARLKFSVFDDGSYPVWDYESAIAAINLRGRLSPEKMKKLLLACKKFAGKEATAAMIKEGMMK